MTRRQEIVRGAVALAAFAIALVVVSRCQASGFDAKTKTIRGENDSLRTVVAIRSARERDSERRVIALAIERNAAHDSATRAIAEANRLRAQRPRLVPVASQPGTAPTVSDTARALESQLENCEAETLALRATIQQDSVAAAKSAQTEAEHAGQLASKDSSIVELRGRLDATERQLAAADAPCRVAFMKCPTRTQVAIGGTVFGVAATLLVLSAAR